MDHSILLKHERPRGLWLIKLRLFLPIGRLYIYNSRLLIPTLNDCWSFLLSMIISLVVPSVQFHSKLLVDFRLSFTSRRFQFTMVLAAFSFIRTLAIGSWWCDPQFVPGYIWAALIWLPPGPNQDVVHLVAVIAIWYYQGFSLRGCCWKQLFTITIITLFLATNCIRRSPLS